MKTAAKVVIILTMIFGCISILPLIFGGITLSKINKAQTASELQTWGILDIFFCGIVSGILVLCIKDEDLQSKPNER